MSTKVENEGKNIVKLTIEVDAQKFEDGLQKSFIKNAKYFNVPGFRKGKAPRHIVEKYYGVEVLYEDAINFVCPEAYDDAVKENDLHPVSRPEIDVVQMEKGKEFIFTATVTVKPEVELGEYIGVEAKKPEINVTDEDVQKEIEKVADKNARMITVEDRPVQKGDYTVIDFEGFVDGVPFEGGKASDYSLQIGSGSFIPGFEDQLIGVKTGEEVDVDVTFPEDYGKKDLAGKPALFKVKVKEIKYKELPAIDDEFAQDVSEFDTLEAYKEDIKKKLLHEAEHRAEHQLEDEVIEKVVSNATVDIPQVMVDNRVESLVQDFDMRLRYQGFDIQKYAEIMGLDMDGFKKQFAERAQKEVKTQLVVEKVANVEKVEVSDEDLDTEITKMAENYKQSVEDFKKHLREDDIEYIKDNLKMTKTIKFLVDNAKIA